MRRSQWTALVLLIFGAITARAQSVQIIDKETNAPLELVTLYSEDPNAFTTTNDEGKARVDIFEDANVINIRLLGYTPLSLPYEDIADRVVFLVPEKWALDQVVISATRWNRSEDRIPVKITTISPESSALYNPQTAADMLGTTGEVFIQKSQQGGGSPMIRGFGANRLLYSVDGIRMNNAIFRSGNIHNVISLDPLAMESTEVMFGPGAVMYGSDAIGAVMAFQTRQPKLGLSEKPEVSGSVFGRLASANFEKTIHTDLEIGGKRWAGVTSLTYTDYDDLVMGTQGPNDFLRPWYVERNGDTDVQIQNPNSRSQLPSGYNQWNFMQKLRFRVNEDWDIQYGLHFSRTSDYDRYDRLIQQEGDSPRSAEWYYGPQQWLLNALEIRHTADKAFYDQAIFRVAHQQFLESRVDRNFQDIIRRSREERVKAISLNADFRKAYSKKTNLNYGIEWVWNDVHSTGSGLNILDNTPVPVSARYPLSTWQSIAGYALLEHRLSDRIDLQAGVRYNLFLLNSDFTNNASFFPLPESETALTNGGIAANLGLVHRTQSEGELRVHLSNGFRAPNVDDIGKVFDSEPGAVVVPNANLRPEYAYNAEIGFNQVFFQALRVDITGYYTWLDNAMVRRVFTFNGMDSILYDGEQSKVQAIQNASNTQIVGVQLGLELRLPENIALNGQINIQDGTDKLEDGTETPTRHAPPLFGMARFTQEFRKWEYMVYAQFSAERKFEDMPVEEIGKPHLYAIDDNGNPYSPGWVTLNVKGSYKLNRTVQFWAGIENLTNRRYRTYSSGLAGAGINFQSSIKITF